MTEQGGSSQQPFRGRKRPKQLVGQYSVSTNSKETRPNQADIPGDRDKGKRTSGDASVQLKKMVSRDTEEATRKGRGPLSTETNEQLTQHSSSSVTGIHRRAAEVTPLTLESRRAASSAHERYSF